MLVVTCEALLEKGHAEALKILEHCEPSKTTGETNKDSAAQSFTKKKMSFTMDSDKSKHLCKGIRGEWSSHPLKEHTVQFNQFAAQVF